MDSARKIYEQIISFKQSDGSGETSQQRFLKYCTEVLGAVERLHFDYKQKHDSRDGKLADNDKRNLAKAISGFSNSNGGVLIWGIEDDSLVPKPIKGIQEFVQSLLEVASLLTDPTVSNIDGDWIPADDGEGGFGVIFIPESTLPPHRVILNNAKVKNQYYTRSGNSFIVATHTQLEDMFGRRPKPVLSLSTRIVPYSRSGAEVLLHVIIGIENKGRGSAKAPFLSIEVHKPYEIGKHGVDGNYGFGLERIANPIYPNKAEYGATGNVVIHPGIVRNVALTSVPVDITKPPSAIYDLIVDYRIAAEGIQLIEGQKVIRTSELWAVVNES